MEVWFLVLFLAGEAIEPPGSFDTLKECTAKGLEQRDAFKEYHPHSKAWFWCYPGRRS